METNRMFRIFLIEKQLESSAEKRILFRFYDSDELPLDMEDNVDLEALYDKVQRWANCYNSVFEIEDSRCLSAQPFRLFPEL